MDTKYCYENCEIGKAAKSVYLALNNSVFDAVAGFNAFTENCFSECPYKSTYDYVCCSKHS